MADPSSLRIAVIGAGPAGLAAGHELLAHGFTNFTIFEATDAVGGTWHIHTYPGLACDVWAHAYTFSYRPNPDWTKSFVDQPEIESYLQKCATEFGLGPHIKLDTRIASARYQGEGCWQLESTAGERFECDVIINAMGNQHTPLHPDVPGIDDFEGASFHGTRWDHSVELKDKRIVIVGSAASAVQIVPEVAKVAGALTVLQRYRILDFDRIEVVGETGESLAAVMEKSPEAFKGIAVPRFPNYFFAVGPNGLPLDAPYFRTAERNLETIVALLREKQVAGARSLVVKPEVSRVYNEWLMEQVPRYSWGSGSCHSYYQDANGRAPFLFPGRFKEYAALHARSGLHEYDLQ